MEGVSPLSISPKSPKVIERHLRKLIRDTGNAGPAQDHSPATHSTHAHRERTPGRCHVTLPQTARPGPRGAGASPNPESGLPGRGTAPLPPAPAGTSRRRWRSPACFLPPACQRARAVPGRALRRGARGWGGRWPRAVGESEPRSPRHARAGRLPSPAGHCSAGHKKTSRPGFHAGLARGELRHQSTCTEWSHSCI